MAALYNWTEIPEKDIFPEMEIFPDDFEKAFSNVWIQTGIVFSVALGCVSCTGIAFVGWFERSGQAGPFRTLINQLATLGLDQLILIFLSGSILEILRLTFGPLHTVTCRTLLFIFLWSCLNSFTFITLISFVKFSFICIFKSIPVMCDNFLSLYIFVSVNFINFLSLSGKFYVEEKVMITERVCTGIWVEEDKFKNSIPLVSWYLIILFGMQFFLALPIMYLKHFKNKSLQQKKQTDMGSLISTIVSGFLFACGGITYIAMQR